MTLKSSILIIDDEASLRKTLTTIIHRAGYQVTSAGTAREAIHFLQKGAYDLVFLDLKLQDTDGIQFLPVIRQMYPMMPVVILTAHASLDSAIEAVRQGARDYLLKPFEPSQILDRISCILTEQQQPKRQLEIISQIQSLVDQLSQMDAGTGRDDQKTAAPALLDPARYLRAGPLTLDLYAKIVMVDDKSITIPPSTYDYLVTLVRHAPSPVAYEILVTEAQGYNVTRTEAREIARWHIYELRKLLEENPKHPRFIITVHDVGYRLVT